MLAQSASMAAHTLKGARPAEKADRRNAIGELTTEITEAARMPRHNH